VGDYTYAASQQVVDRIVTVSEAGIRQATRQLLLEGHVYVEPGASVGLAALNEGQIETNPDCPTALIVTGANMDPEDVGKYLIT
jgi:threonine dehydratase